MGQQQQQQCPQQRPINSTTAPRWMANMPVLVDVDHARMPWGGRPPFQGNRGFNSHATQMMPLCSNKNRACFNYGQPGHFACNCLQKHHFPTNANHASLLNFNEDDTNLGFFDPEPEQEQDHIIFMKTQLNAISLKDKTKLAEELGVLEDFQSAWLGQP